MANKNTKRALLSSAFTLVLCFAMLLGTTFAWFTDTSSTSVNTIQAGTLSVDIVDANDSTLEGQKLSFKDVQGSTSILWEPGATFTTETFKIANKGNLALKFNFALNGITGDAELLDVITFKVVDKDGNEVNLNSFTGHLTKNATSDEYAIKATMATSAGNQYQGKSLEGVSLVVYATQDTVEYDSTTKEYDKDATLPSVDAVAVSTVEELANALANGGAIVLTKDITTTTEMKITKDGTFDGNGNAITSTANNGLEVAKGTIKNVTIKNAYRGIFLNNPTGNIVVDNVMIDDCGYGINTGAGDSTATLTVTNSTINGWNSWANLASASFTNCSFGTSTYYENEVFQHLVRPYVTSTFKNCEFEKGFYIQIDKLTGTVTLENCTCDGVKLTGDNFADYVKLVTGFDASSNAILATNGNAPSNVIFK